MMATLTAPPEHVAIIGAGLAGLTLALALHQHNISCAVYEARPESFDQGGGIMLSPNALRVLDSVGVYGRIRDRALEFDVLTFKNSEDQTTDIYYFGSRKLYEYDAIRIMRTELLRELRLMVKERNIPVHFDSKITETSENNDKVDFTLSNGSKGSAALLIGADGIHSTVRRSFLPDVTPKYVGFMGISGVVERSKLRVPEGYNLPATVMAKPGAFLLVPQKPDASELFIGSQRRFEELDPIGWDVLRKDKQKLYDMLQGDKNEWPDIVQSALEGMTVKDMNFWAFYAMPPLSSWASESKRIILVGDAAHAIPPTAGQGANQAFEDVHSLATLLSKLSSKVTLDKAVDKWQAYRQDRVRRVMELTQQMNAKRLPEEERLKLPPGTVWEDASLTRGEGGELKWLYDPDMGEEAMKWITDLEGEV